MFVASGRYFSATGIYISKSSTDSMPQRKSLRRKKSLLCHKCSYWEQYYVSNFMARYQSGDMTHRAGHRCSDISKVYTLSIKKYYIQMSTW